ncbi:luciferase family oxidoreductase group 1 [Litorivivens lipolytica]|uniref:Luciferase-like monooxygenase n=1 Tax=Litorivivens lipolytica TaxID=1524264 RepID=A0A7W4Z6B5_9GAMM|nr:LLM class flavin-dependent oxidoreductase [Litorivivens lipolytica]MBB3046741.1 luciferase family oxidoreductase group 1 [Litorivivens lipolytica]
MTRFAVLDLCSIREGGSIAESFANSVALAQHAEGLGFSRFWLAEHHNFAGIASAATSLVIGHVAAATQTIRVGAGGIMLPNHAPLVIAEQFGTLEALHPGRIDLGLGRAPGTDQLTINALRRNLDGDVSQFPRDVVELLRFLDEPKPGQAVVATPGAGSRVPVWILGSSLFGAQLAASLGLPFGFASHFAPAQLYEAIQLYRERFKPSEFLEEPYVMAGFNVIAADSFDEADLLASSMRRAFVNLRRGQPGKLQPPSAEFNRSLGGADQMLLSQIMACSAVGDKDVVAEKLAAFIDDTGVDEIIFAGQVFDLDARLRSFEIVSEVMSSL